MFPTSSIGPKKEVAGVLAIRVGPHGGGRNSPKGIGTAMKRGSPITKKARL